MTNPNMALLRGYPSKLSYICCCLIPPKMDNLMIPDLKFNMVHLKISPLTLGRFQLWKSSFSGEPFGQLWGRGIPEFLWDFSQPLWRVRFRLSINRDSVQYLKQNDMPSLKSMKWEIPEFLTSWMKSWSKYADVTMLIASASNNPLALGVWTHRMGVNISTTKIYGYRNFQTFSFKFHIPLENSLISSSKCTYSRK